MRISRKLLAETLRIAGATSPVQATVPILATTRLDLVSLATGPVLRINATNLEQHLEVELPVTVDAFDPSDRQTVAACINTRLLKKVIRGLPKGQTEVEIVLPSDPTAAAVMVGGMKLVAALHGEDFPPCPAGSMDFKRFDYRELARVLSAASHDENPYALNGVLIDFERGILATTDGHRLYVNACLAPQSGPTCILPRTAADVAGMASPLPALSIQEAGTNQAEMVTIPLANGRLVSRTIEGQFPTIEAVVPKPETMTTTLEVNPQLLREVLMASLTVSNDTRVEINGAITIKASDPEKGTFERTVPGSYTGKPLVVGFKGRHLIDALDATGLTLTTTIRFKGDDAPCLVEQAGGSLFAVIMPMRL